MRSILKPLRAASVGCLLCLPSARAEVSTSFTYQGRLVDDCCPASGLYDMTFAVYGVPTLGVQLAPPLNKLAVPVSNGLFSVGLDFGSAVFNGPARWLQISVRTNTASSSGAFVPLLPRVELGRTPYAIWAGMAGGVLDGGVTATALAPQPQARQILSYSGSSLQWIDAPAFSLPFQASANSSLPLLALNNSGSGPAMKLSGNSSSGFPFAVLHVDGGNANRGIYAYDVTGTAIQGDSWAGVAVSGDSSNTGFGLHGSSRRGTGAYGVNRDTGNSGQLGTVDEGVLGRNGTTGTYGALGTYQSGVVAGGNGPLSTAITIESGAIRIPNAHLSTTTPAFRVTASAANSSAGPEILGIEIDHPLLNFSPDALAYLTANGKPNGQENPTLLTYTAGLAYLPSARRWFVLQPNPNNSLSLANFIGYQFSILVIKP